MIEADPGGVTTVDWSPDGERLASGGVDRFVRVWDATTGELFDEWGPTSFTIREVDWSHDGERLAAISQDGWVYVWESASGAKLYSLSPGDLHEYECPQRSLAWSPTDKLLATSGESDTVHIRDGDSGHIVRTLPGSLGLPTVNKRTCVPSVAWSPDGSLLAGALRGSGDVLVWDTASWEVQHRIAGRTYFVYDAEWSPDGSRLAVTSHVPEIAIWNTRSWSLHSTLSTKSGPFTVAWAGSTLAASGSDGVARVWDLESRRVVGEFLGNDKTVWSIDWSPGAERVAAAGQDGAIRVWNVLPDSFSKAFAESALAAWLPGERLVASCEVDGLTLSS